MDYDSVQALHVLVHASMVVNKTFTHHENQGFVIVSAGDHLRGRTRLGMLGLGAGTTVGILIGPQLG